jgi:hypothetical protein
MASPAPSIAPAASSTGSGPAAPALSKAVAKLTAELNGCRAFVMKSVGSESTGVNVKVSDAFDEYIRMRQGGKVPLAGGKRKGGSLDGVERPKKAPNAYNLFVGETIKRLRLETPGLPLKDAMRQASALWREQKPAVAAPAPAPAPVEPAVAAPAPVEPASA